MDGLTTSTRGKSMRPETGAMSCSRLNGSASKRGDVHGRGRRNEHQRVAVRGSTDGRLDRDIGGGAGLVFDDDRLAETLRQPLGHDARHGVGPAARRKRSSAAAASGSRAQVPIAGAQAPQRPLRRVAGADAGRMPSFPPPMFWLRTSAPGRVARRYARCFATNASTARLNTSGSSQ
jgi:hypothetical protein